MSSLAIPDGHTLTGWINEVPGLYERIQFTFRRMTGEEFAEYLHAVNNMTEPQAQRLISAHLATRITQWDISDGKGGVRPVSEEATRSLPRMLSQRLWRIVAGLEGPDGIVGQDKSDADAEYKAALEAARTGRPVQQVREDEARKNSPSA